MFSKRKGMRKLINYYLYNNNINLILIRYFEEVLRLATKKSIKDIGIPHSKDEFINTLMSMSPVEINEFIKKNGKPPKRISPFIKVIKD